MKYFIYLMIFLCSTFSIFSEKKSEEDMIELSKSLGQFIGKHLHETGLNLDIEQIISGIKEANKGNMDDEKSILAIEHLQKIYLEKIRQNNLKKAEEFLSKNANDKEIIEITKNKLQYKILQKGKGTKIATHHTPLVRYELKTLDGKKIEKISDGCILYLDELTEGLKTAIVGMQKNEKRKIYIHPELGFGENKPSFSNSLLIYEIEIIEINQKANTQNAEIASEKKV